MEEETVLGMTTRTGTPDSPDGPAEPGARAQAPVPIPGFLPLRQERKGVVRALAFSRDYLDGCIELISEGKPAPVMTIIEELKRDIISQALVMSRSNIRGAAFLLGVKYTTLYAQVKKYERQFLAARLKAREYVPAGDVTLRS